MSLYWHPAVYRFNAATKLYELASIWFASAYYIWQTGKASAFPKGFKMLTSADLPKAKANFGCADGSGEPEGHQDFDAFPSVSCYELEVSLSFPTCWDGKNLDSPDHTSHVAYDTSREGEFDGSCPHTHPVKIPQIDLYFRILNYQGREHKYSFSDGTSIYHSDYMSGWDEDELQTVLDECSNESDGANPDAWCESHVTFRDAPKKQGDSGIVSKLTTLQPNVKVDTKALITQEAITQITALPRGACTGTLLSVDGSGATQQQQMVTMPPMAPPDYPTLAKGTCASQGWVPITTLAGCNTAAAYFDTTNQAAKSTGASSRPEGCYITASSGSVWFATSTANAGNGGTAARHQVCVRTEAAAGITPTKLATTSPPATPRPTTAAPTTTADTCSAALGAAEKAIEALQAEVQRLQATLDASKVCRARGRRVV